MLTRHQWIALAIALSGTLACASLTWLQWNIIQMRREVEIEEQVHSRWDVVNVELKRAEDLQDTVAAFVEATNDVGREQFEMFAASLPPVNFRAISYAAYVPAAKRAEFERRLGTDNPPALRIWEHGPDGQPRAAAERDAYLPVTYIFPASGNRGAVGFDLLSESRREHAIRAAIRTGKTVRTDPLRLVQDPERWAFIVYKPVYARRGPSGAVAANPPELIGVVGAVYQFGALLEEAVKQRKTAKHQIALFDTSAPSFPVHVHYSEPTAYRRADLERPLTAVAAMPGARVVSAPAMQNELSAVFFADDASNAWWHQINVTIYATLVVGLLLTAALVRNHVRAHRLSLQLVKATEDGRIRKEEAERASVAKSRLLAYASHDLRQPLHAMELFVAHLKERPLEYETAKLVGNVDDCVQALGELLDALLDLSRLESGAIQPVLQATPVAELWKRLHDVFAETASVKNLELRFRPTPLWVMTDRRLLHRIMLNLVSNAVRYTSTGGVLVACRRAGNHARLQVWDTGRGIAAKDREEVFKEFVQLDSHDSHPTRGLGLGLSIVERTARLLGHRLGMRTVPGRGSCFSVDVPIAEPVAATAAAAETPALTERESFTGFTVLVVEDDLLARRALADLLRSWRCSVIEVSTAEEAQKALGEGCRPDLVACDYQLPNHANGIDVIARVRAILGSEIPAFIVTGDTSNDVTAAAEAAGLLLLQKPFKAARLRRVLDLLLRARHATRD